jgi:hypothetical protein
MPTTLPVASASPLSTRTRIIDIGIAETGSGRHARGPADAASHVVQKQRIGPGGVAVAESGVERSPAVELM